MSRTYRHQSLPHPYKNTNLAPTKQIIPMTDFKTKSFLASLLLKMRDAEEYKNYKYLARLNRIAKPVALDIPFKPAYTFKHSGNAGDLIYSLPAARKLAGDGKADYLLQLGQQGHYGKKSHPLGGVMLNEKMLQMLQPLLTAQSYIASCQPYTGQAVDYDFDLIRSFPFPNSRGNISRWYFYLFATSADLAMPWLQVKADTQFNDHLVIARSQRYRAPGISYAFLKKYSKIAFVGVEEEWKEMKEAIPGIAYHPVSDFLQLASVIAGSKLFIGNQSFPFSLAEGLKTNRLLEVYHLCPNVNVEGQGANDFCYQPQFERMVKNLYEGD